MKLRRNSHQLFPQPPTEKENLKGSDMEVKTMFLILKNVYGAPQNEVCVEAAEVKVKGAVAQPLCPSVACAEAKGSQSCTRAAPELQES